MIMKHLLSYTVCWGVSLAVTRTPCWSDFWWPEGDNPKKRTLISWVYLKWMFLKANNMITTYPFLTERNMWKPQLHIILCVRETIVVSLNDPTMWYIIKLTILMFWVQYLPFIRCSSEDMVYSMNDGMFNILSFEMVMYMLQTSNRAQSNDAKLSISMNKSKDCHCPLELPSTLHHSLYFVWM